MFCHNRIPVACKVSDFLDLITFSIMYTVEKEFDTFAESTSLFATLYKSELQEFDANNMIVRIVSLGKKKSTTLFALTFQG